MQWMMRYERVQNVRDGPVGHGILSTPAAYGGSGRPVISRMIILYLQEAHLVCTAGVSGCEVTLI